MNRDQQTHMGPSDACYYADHRGCPFPTMCECSCHKSLAGDSTPPATPEHGWCDVCPICGGHPHCPDHGDRRASHPPAVSGEGERLKKFREHLKRGLIPMTDQTPDPWDYLAEFIEGNAVRPPGGQQVGPPRYPLVPSVAKELRGIVEAGKRALAAERAQHQQEKDAAWNALHVRDQALLDAQDQVTQRDETIRQLQAEVQRQKDLVLAQTRLGSEAFERAHAAEAQIATLTQELSVSRANHIDANQRNMQSVRELEAAEARCATLTAALKALYEVFDCESVAEGCEFGYQTCSAISEARAALSGVPAPESKPK